MQHGHEHLNFQQWIDTCPASLPTFRDSLCRIKDTSSTLKDLLDNLIYIIGQCNVLRAPFAAALEQKQEDRFLALIQQQCYKWVGILVDKPNLCYRDILTIYYQRRLNNAHLPNHLPGELLEAYTGREIEEFQLELENLDTKVAQPLTQIEKEKILLFREKMLREQYRRRRFAYLGNLAKPKVYVSSSNNPATLTALDDCVIDGTSIRIGNQAPVNIMMQGFEPSELAFSVLVGDKLNIDGGIVLQVKTINPPQVHCRILHGGLLHDRAEILRQEGWSPRVLKIENIYFEKEVLTKAINGTRIPTLNLPKLRKKIQKYKNCLSKIDEITTIEEVTKGHIKGNLSAVLNEAERFLEDIATNEQNKNQIIYWKLLSNIKDDLIRILNSYPGYDLQKLRDVFLAVTPYPGLFSEYETFKAENQQHFLQTNISLKAYYLNQNQREEFRLHLVDGHFYAFSRNNGGITLRPYSSQTFRSHAKNGWVACVMNLRGEIFASSHNERYLHSSFMSGGPVLFAGEMKIGSKGELLAVSNYSGHYLPNFINLQDFARHLSKRKVDLSRCEFYAIDEKILSQRLNKISGSRGLSEEKKKQLHDQVINESQTLKLSTRYRFSNGQLLNQVEVKKVLLYVAASLLVVVGLTLITTLVLASKGLVLPFIAPILTKVGTGIGFALGAMTAGAGVGIALSYEQDRPFVSAFTKLKTFFKETLFEDDNPVSSENSRELSGEQLQQLDRIPSLLARNSHARINAITSDSYQGRGRMQTEKFHNISVPINDRDKPNSAKVGTDLALEKMYSIPECSSWNEFVRKVTSNLFASSFNEILIDLKDKLSVLTLAHFKERGAHIPREFYVWNSANLYTLFVKIAQKLAFDGHYQKLKMLERKLFIPLIKIMNSYFEKNNKPDRLDFLVYEQKKNEMVSEEEEMSGEHQIAHSGNR